MVNASFPDIWPVSNRSTSNSESERVTLIGDCAHPMAPLVSEGNFLNFCELFFGIMCFYILFN